MKSVISHAITTWALAHVFHMQSAFFPTEPIYDGKESE